MAEYISIITDIILILFFGWYLIVRRGLDKRIDSLSKTLGSVTDVITNNFSWKRTAEEITAMEEALRKRHELEKETASEENSQLHEKSRVHSIHAEADFRIMVQLIQSLVPEENRKVVAEVIEAQGETKNSRIIKALRGEPLNEKNA